MAHPAGPVPRDIPWTRPANLMISMKAWMQSGCCCCFGLGIIYIILGTQFRSYFQPFMVLATVPLTFTGVTLGCW